MPPLGDTPHRRLDLLTGEWVLVSPHRAARPWQGRVEPTAAPDRPAHDPACYLCPGTVRANGERNPDYAGVFVFDNDFPALRPDAGTRAPRRRADDPPDAAGPDRRAVTVAGLLKARPEAGVCRVVCFSPRHDLTLAEMDAAGVRAVVDAWADETERLGARPDVGHVQVFENKGEVMGCSNPHPHGQVWAQRSVPRHPAVEGERQRAHHERHGRTLLADYLAIEEREGERVVLANDHAVVVVPWWAVWPFEVLVVPRRPVARLADLHDVERDAFADALRRVAARYDNLFETSFPYSAGIHQAPTDGRAHPAWHLHAHFYPPLLRSATVRKFLVGYEMLAEPQRDITPEAAAERLAGLSDVHYRSRA